MITLPLRAISNSCWSGPKPFHCLPQELKISGPDSQLAQVRAAPLRPADILPREVQNWLSGGQWTNPGSDYVSLRGSRHALPSATYWGFPAAWWWQPGCCWLHIPAHWSPHREAPRGTGDEARCFSSPAACFRGIVTAFPAKKQKEGRSQLVWNPLPSKESS